MSAPNGLYHGEHSLEYSTQALKAGTRHDTRYKATQEYRSPRKGEFYLSGAEIEAYIARCDLSGYYWIAVPVKVEACQHCQGTGKVEVMS